MTHYLMVDLGTGNSRVAIVSARGEIVDIISFANTYYPDPLYADAQYFLPEEWEKRILDACRELMGRNPEVSIRAVSSAGARQSIVLLDKDGRAFYGLPNIDNRGYAYLSEIPDHQGIYRKSGKWVTEDFDAAKLYGLRKKRPDAYDRIAKLTSLSEWIGYIFTREAFCEPSQACETQLYDIHNRRWSSTLCKAYRIDMALLPELRCAGDAIPILPEYRALLRMPEDGAFLVGGADTQVAAIQTGLSAGGIAVVSGTTSPVVAKTETAPYDEKQRIWVDAGLGAQGYLAETNPGVTGLNYQKFHAGVCPDLDYDRLEKVYAEKTGFCCTAAFSSLLFHERRGLRKGGFFARSPMGDGFDRVDMAWAVLGDIACSINEQLGNLKELTGNRSETLLGCGGGFQSGTLCQMLSDLSGMELVLYDGYRQATLMGLVALCNAAVGEAPRETDGRAIRYTPAASSLIHEYRPVWKENRDRSNGISAQE